MVNEVVLVSNKKREHQHYKRNCYRLADFRTGRTSTIVLHRRLIIININEGEIIKSIWVIYCHSSGPIYNEQTGGWMLRFAA